MNNCKVFLATEVRIYKVDDHFYADAPFAKILERYNRSFGKLSLATRIINEKNARDGYVQIDKYCCNFDNVGSLLKFVTKKTPVTLLSHLMDADLVIMRLPSFISIKIYRLIRKYKKKYLAEVMGCIWDAYWNHGILGKILAPGMFLKMRRMVKRADYCVYVTQSFLQKRYPCNNESIGLSNVDIPDVATPKSYSDFNKKNISLMTSAALDVRYKGQEYVIKAMRELRDKHGINTTYFLAGKGSDERLRKIAEQNGVINNVVFCGMLSRDELSKTMRKADIYIQPSLQEGLPRSLIEAMSQGCICLGSNTAGIPELLKSQFIFKRKSMSAIVNSVLDITKSRELSTISKNNVDESKKYLSSVLDKERLHYYNKVKDGLLLNDGSRKVRKIAIINNHLIGGGAERVICNLANYLCEKGYDVDLIATVGKKGSYVLDKRINKTYLMDGFTSSNKLFCLRERYKRLRRYVLTHRDVTCYIAMMPSNVFMLTRMRGLANASIIISERNNPSSYGVKEQLMMRYAAKRCDGLVVQTNTISQWYANTKRKIIIPNAINKDIAFPSRKTTEKKIVTVARLERQKNYPLLISAFSIFEKKYPDYTLEIYGQGSQEEVIRDMITKYNLANRVRLMGFVKDIPNHIADAECFVLSSNYEGIPNALIEAMCIGLPCISTDCDGGGARELIEHRKNGLLVQKDNAEEMAAAMIEIAENKNLREALSNEAKKLKQRLDGEIIYGKWVSFIDQVINEKKRSKARSRYR